MIPDISWLMAQNLFMWVLSDLNNKPIYFHWCPYVIFKVRQRFDRDIASGSWHVFIFLGRKFNQMRNFLQLLAGCRPCSSVGQLVELSRLFVNYGLIVELTIRRCWVDLSQNSMELNFNLKVKMNEWWSLK